jgi:transcriptional regulator with XRE-family HTH domain
MSSDEVRNVLGSSLEKARKAAGLTGAQLGERLGWRPSTGKGKVSKIEGGDQTPTDEELSAWSKETSAGERLLSQWLSLAAEAREEQQPNYQQRLAGGQHRIQKQYTDRAENTTRFVFFETAVIPRYLQTPDYMRAVLQEHHEKHGTINDVEASVKERQNSTRFLLDGAKDFTFLLDESILRGTRFPAAIMRPQLFQLMTASNLDTVTLGIYPSLSRPVGSYTESSFEIFDDIAFIETALADERKLLADDVAILERLFARYWQDAVTGDDARAMISDAMAALS